MEIIEKRFRGSMICRVMGYPISYGITKMLFEQGKSNLTDIVKKAKRTKSTVCFHLTKLRIANIVRYEKKGRETFYWIKYPDEVNAILIACEALVKRSTMGLDADI